MTPSLRSAFVRSLCALALATTGSAALAEARVIKMLVGFPPGAGTDTIARLLADKLKDELGAALVVENKGGAGGQLAALALKAAPADGRTFFMTHAHTISVVPLTVKSPGYEPAKDFVPVAGFASFVNALALAPGTPAKNLAEYVAWVKAVGAGKGVVGVPAPASTSEFMVQLLGGHFQLDLVAVPYRGSAPLISDMLGNQINAGIGSVPDFIDEHKGGLLRIVAVGGTVRQVGLPGVPTLAELGMAGFEDPPYYGFFAPAGTPKAALEGFSAALARVVHRPEMKTRLTAMGLSVEFMDAAALAARERAYTGVWADFIRRSGFTPR